MLVRLLPCAVVVAGDRPSSPAMLLLPEGRWPQTLREVVAAALFLENWQLAADAVDYAARSNMSSPVQHFWSLSIQGQFFLVWPLLVALVALAGAGRRRPGARAPDRRDARRVRRLADVYSVVLTAHEPAAGLLPLADPAVGVRARRPARPARSTRSGCPRADPGRRWAGSGVVGLLVVRAVLQVAHVFPGIAALWPTGCAVLVLLAGVTGARRRRGPAADLPAAALRRRPELPAVPVALAGAGVLPGAHRPRPARPRGRRGRRRAVAWCSPC